MKTQWFLKLVRRSTQDRWEVTHVSAGHNVRVHSHWTRAVLCVSHLVSTHPSDKKDGVNTLFSFSLMSKCLTSKRHVVQ